MRLAPIGDGVRLPGAVTGVTKAKLDRLWRAGPFGEIFAWGPVLGDAARHADRASTPRCRTVDSA
jgi:hypothetical protein